MTSARSLGILIDRSPSSQNGESSFYRDLVLACMDAGVRAFLFRAADVRWGRRRILGWLWDRAHSQWVQRALPFPSHLYNRLLHADGPAARRAREQLRRLLSRSQATLVQRPISGKWRMHQRLRRHARLRRYVPASARWRGPAQLAGWLRRFGAAVLKPVSGAEGRGVLLLERETGSSRAHPSDRARISVRGRTAGNERLARTFSDEAVGSWLRTFVAGRHYLIQRALTLRTAEGAPFDVRAFTIRQKEGGWQLLGMAARVGPKDGVTSNLAGGARAREVHDVLSMRFGEQKSSAIQQTIHSLSLLLSYYTENLFGRIIELGLDFGVDPNGHVWLLEINGKPGRSIFLHLRRHDLYQQSIMHIVEQIDN